MHGARDVARQHVFECVLHLGVLVVNVKHSEQGVGNEPSPSWNFFELAIVGERAYKNREVPDWTIAHVARAFEFGQIDALQFGSLDFLAKPFLATRLKLFNTAQAIECDGVRRESRKKKFFIYFRRAHPVTLCARLHQERVVRDESRSHALRLHHS